MENTIIGKRRENTNMKPVIGEDPWKESPFYAQTTDGEVKSEHLLPWSVGMTLAGIFEGLRVANKQKAATEQRDYAVFRTDDGELFRAYAGGQMKYALSQIPEGTYVEITYKGKEYVERLSKEVHQYDVLRPDDNGGNLN